MITLDFLIAGPVMPFSIALTVMLFIGLLEGLTTLLGFALSGLIDNILPEADIDVGLDVGDLDDPGAFAEFLSWLRVKEVPVVIIFIVFLMSFGLSGIALQLIFQALFSTLVPALIAAPASLFLCLPFVRLFAGIAAKIMPRDETEAVSSSSFIGRMATIILGEAASGSPAQAKLRDRHGHSHYVMLEPDTKGDVFRQRETVLIVREDNNIFYAIRTDSEHLNG